MVAAAAAAEQRRLEGAAEGLRRNVGALLRDGCTVMTTSLSSSVLAAVKEAAGAWVAAQLLLLATPWPTAGPGAGLQHSLERPPAPALRHLLCSARHAAAGGRVRGAAAVRRRAAGGGLGGGGRGGHAHHRCAGGQGSSSRPAASSACIQCAPGPAPAAAACAALPAPTPLLPPATRPALRRRRACLCARRIWCWWGRMP